MNNCIRYIVIILLINLSCTRQQEELQPSTITPKIVEARGHLVPEDSLDEPEIVPAGAPEIVRAVAGKIVPTNTHIHPVGRLKTVKAGTPRTIVPGQDGFLLPVTVQAIDSSFDAGVPEVSVAKDPSSKEGNPQNFCTFSKHQGLKHGDVTCMLQDKTGNLWIGTGGGVTKYDGRCFTNYTEKEGLIFNEVLSMIKDHAGNLWIGTIHGVSRLSRDGKKMANFTTKEGLSEDHCTSILQDASGNIWFGSLLSGVSRLNQDGRSFTYFTTKEGLASNQVLTLFEDARGNIWFGTSNGVSKYNGRSFINYSEKDGLANKPVTCILEDAGENIWFGTDGEGASCLSRDGTSFTNFSEKEGLCNNSVHSILLDNNGDLWFGTNGGGVSRLSKDSRISTDFTEKEGLANNRVICIFKDTKGNLWFGTKDRGVSRYNGKLFTHYTKAEGLNNTIVWSILEDKKGDLWVGTESGVSRLSRDRRTFTHFTEKEGFSSHPVYCILEDGNENLWFATMGDGIIQLSQDGQRFTHYTEKEGLCSNFTRSIAEDKNGNFWISSLNGDCVSRLSKDRKNFTRFTEKEGLSENTVRPILQDKSGDLWFGTDMRGVTRLSQDGKIVMQYTVRGGLSHNSVHTLFEDQDGNIWICTYGGGVSRLSSDRKQFTHYTEKEGLSNNNVFSGLESRTGDLWFGTRFGLNKLTDLVFDGTRERFFQTYTFEDGFTGIGVYEGAITEDSQGTIWIGANDRLTAYHPEGDYTDTVAPCIQLTNIELFNEDIPWTLFGKNKDTTIVLGNGVKVGNFHFDSLSAWYSLPENLSLVHDNNFLTFHFTGITLKQSKKVKYRYKLEGFDENWSALTSRTDAPYGNLPQGNYTFKVKAMNSDGYWSDELDYKFSIRPPWHKTVWFRLLTIVLVLLALFLLHQWRTATLRRRKRQLEKTVAERTAEVVHQKEEIECQKEEVECQKKELENTLDKLKQTQSQLIQSEKMASLGMLTAGIAHEINNPVNFINSGAISLQKDYEDLQRVIQSIGQLPPESKKIAEEIGLDDLLKIIPQTIEDIQTGVSRTSEIVKGLRNFTRMDATELKEADIHEGIDSTLLLLSHKIKDQIRIVKEYDDRIGFIRCYPGPLNQVFMNLLNNAIDAIEQKIKDNSFEGETPDTKSMGDHYQIGIKTKLIVEGIKKLVKVVISDNGVGIRDEIRDKLFDPFFTTKEVGKGTGLGLSICHGIIEKHGGSITFESKVSEGTAFTITLPV